MENRKLTKVHVPTLRRHEISMDNATNHGSDTAKYVRIRRPGDGKARISYRPDVRELQTLLKNKHALQFSVQYEVERLGKGGEIEVTKRVQKLSGGRKKGRGRKTERTK